MKSRNMSKDDDLIDIGKIFKSLWRDKFIILAISAIFSIIGYFYGENLPRYYETKINIRSTPKYLFEAYDGLYNYKQNHVIYGANDYYNEEFMLFLESSETTEKFIKQNNQYNNLLPYIYQGTIIINESKKSKKIKPHTITYKLVLTEKFDNQDFLNDYVMFVKHETKKKFIDQSTILINSKIIEHKKNLEVAREINLENPILKSMVEGNTVVNEPEALFYRGSKVLKKQLDHLESLKSELNEFTLDYNLILDKASPLVLTSTPSKNFIIPSFFIGILFSCFILIIRNSLRNNNKTYNFK
ncbi:MAG: hypothetical protein CMC22_07050 [Flavobacteriaceae bacterium]|nr:hypothetical protein [Flavobacteriaceae bacterium]